MRRITSVFKRSDKSKHDQSQSTPSAAPDTGTKQLATRSNALPRQPLKKGRFLSSITVSTEPPPVPSLDQNHSSSSSADSATCSLQTPEDDHGSQMGVPMPSSHTSRKAWLPWQSRSGPRVVSTSPSLPSPPLQWSKSATTAVPASFPQQSIHDSPDSEEEISSSSSSSSEAPRSMSSQPFRTDRMLAPTEYFAALSVSNLTPALSQPPLLHASDAPLFPRSMNPTSSLPPPDSLEISMHRRKVIARIQRHDLSPADRHMILAFGSRPAYRAEPRWRMQPDEGARYDLRCVSPHSRGLRRWIHRPYFEERVSVWMPEPTSGTVIQTTVKSSGYGVLALEISETLELLAGSDDAKEPACLDVPLVVSLSDPGSSFVSERSPWPEKVVTSSASPSPLRNQSGINEGSITASLSSPASFSSISSAQPSRSPSLPTLPSSVSASSANTVMPPVPDSAAPRREVRFTPNSAKEDKVPKDYVLRIQKNREEKARFLREEQRRREHEAERLKHEQERRQWEDEKRRWEREKRMLEEERRRKSYADELVAARARRDAQHLLPSQVSRDFRETYSRPVYDRRQGSDGSTGGNRPRENSSGSSQRGSSSGYASAPRTPSDSRPPSTFSTHSVSSTDDGRARETRSGRRTSYVSDAGSLHSVNSMMAYGWPMMPPVPPLPAAVSPVMPGYAVPMMPMLPQFAAMPIDMPLLPPNAPFMMHGNSSRSRTSSRSSSRNASPARSSRVPNPGPNNRSSERVGAGSAAHRGRSHQRMASGESGRAQQLPHERTVSASRSRVNTANSHSGQPVRPPHVTAQSSRAVPMSPHVPHSAPLPQRRSTAFA